MREAQGVVPRMAERQTDRGFNPGIYFSGIYSLGCGGSCARRRHHSSTQGHSP